MTRSTPPTDGRAPVLVSRQDGVTTLTMNRAKSLNGWTAELLLALRAALEAAATDPATDAVVLTGSGRYYCAGVNLSGTLQLAPPPQVHERIRSHNQALFDLFIEFPKPLVAAINGPTIGAAVTTATLCDLVLAVPAATFSTPFAALAVPPEGCSSVVFPRVMGAEQAERMLGAEGWVPNAAEAAAVGLIDGVVEPVALLPTARAKARELADAVAAGGPARRYRGPSTREELLAANAAESIQIANAFLSPPFLRAQTAFLWRKRKRVPAMVFATLWATRPAWGWSLPS
ncbi:MAG: hypothetical protein RIT45_3465 [Pseudomonadota bacterium]